MTAPRTSSNGTPLVTVYEVDLPLVLSVDASTQVQSPLLSQSLAVRLWTRVSETPTWMLAPVTELPDHRYHGVTYQIFGLVMILPFAPQVSTTWRSVSPPRFVRPPHKKISAPSCAGSLGTACS